MKDSLKKLGDDYGLTPEGVRHAIETYQKIICEITGGRLSKLTYDTDYILGQAKQVNYQNKQCVDCVYRTNTPIGCTQADYAYFSMEQDGECKVRTVKEDILKLIDKWIDEWDSVKTWAGICKRDVLKELKAEIMSKGKHG